MGGRACEGHRRLSDTIPAFAKEQRRFIEVVRLAPELNVRDRRLSSLGERLDMMELEKRRFPASTAGADKGATTLIALPDCAPDRRRDIAAGAGFGSRRTGRQCRGAAVSFEIREEQGQRPVKKRRQIA